MKKIYLLTIIACFYTLTGIAQQVSSNLPWSDGYSVDHGGVKIKQDNPKSEPFSGTLTLSPNPANDFFKITTDEKISKVHIINMLGKIVKSFDASPGQTYDITQLPAGVYFVKLEHAESTKSKTIRIKIQH
jgi:hypothetical protein